MRYYILTLLLINLIGFYKYIDYSDKTVSYRTQMLTDFFCPIGGLIGRILFAFKLRENAMGIVMGIFFYIFISVFSLGFIL